MKYMLLIHQGSTPTPRSEGDGWEKLSADEQQAVYAAYKAINETPGVTPGNAMDEPETATTVRVRNGKISTTDGPYAETKDQLGGFYLIDAKDLNDAIQVASKIPGARDGAIEIRPVIDFSQDMAKQEQASAGARA